ncbi:MAG: hypothetical protein D8M58_13040 [Calditrichaeota bacterium]|nr:MAG: hypothetical protein DWQ03_13825 [Calditrichota bacterium]MBL1206325.1 hypothetical protein [Calditrichota bacterium]NOG46151.1 hypothetical protein [Calditrichota bacterium]
MSCYPDFKWYYFDLHSPDGHDIICTIHPKPFNSVFPIAIFDIYIYKDNRVLLHHFFVLPASQETFSEDPFRLEYDKNNFITKTGNEIFVKVQDEKLDLELSFKDKLQIKEPPKNKLLNDPNIQAAFDWIVYAPLCEGKGKVNWDGNQLNLEGRGYHDFNSGSGNLKKALKYWYWGKYFIEDELFIYGEIISKNKITTKIALDVTNSGLTIDHSPEVKSDKNKINYESNQKNFAFTLNKSNKIDDIIFFMSGLSKQFTLFIKIIEVLFHISGKYKVFSVLKKMIANSRYVRYRRTGKLDDGREVTCFYEEMFM